MVLLHCMYDGMVQITEPLHPPVQCTYVVVSCFHMSCIRAQYMTPTLFLLSRGWPRKPQTLASYRHDFPLATWKTRKHRQLSPPPGQPLTVTQPTIMTAFAIWPSATVGRTFHPEVTSSRMWKALRLQSFLVGTSSSNGGCQGTNTVIWA